ncbi:MAG: hypothetical protein ACRD30_02385 [Bryobacteraceae bacterium]
MMAAAPRAPWQNPRIVTTLALVFLAGAAAGALSMSMGLHEKLHHVAEARSRAATREAVLNRFQSQLDLDGAQTQKLGMVLDDYSQYYESLQDQLDDLRATGKTRIMQILNANQRAKFEKMMNQLAPDLAPAK